MTRHVNIVLGQTPTAHQVVQIEDKLQIFLVEHLIPQVIGCSPNDFEWEFDWEDSNELRFSFDYGTTVRMDYDIDRQLIRYLELSIIPLVYYGDEVIVQGESHDASMDEEGYCEGCGRRYEQMTTMTVLTTSQKFNDYIGA